MKSTRIFGKILNLLSLMMVILGGHEYYTIFEETIGHTFSTPWGIRNIGTPPHYHWIQIFVIGSIIFLFTLFFYSPEVENSKKNQTGISFLKLRKSTKVSLEGESYEDFLRLRVLQVISGIFFGVSLVITPYSSVQLRDLIGQELVYTTLDGHKTLFLTYVTIFLFVSWLVISKRLEKYYLCNQKIESDEKRKELENNP